MSLPAETQLGPYKIIAPIGSGAMGEVYRARDTRLQRDVALKTLPASFTNDADRLRRFEQEARSVAALNHPNIVGVYDVGQAAGVHYIVSELLEGEALRQRIPATGMPGPQSLRTCRAIRQRSRRPARAGDCSPRPQAGKHFRYSRRPPENSRFRPGQTSPPAGSHRNHQRRNLRRN